MKEKHQCDVTEFCVTIEDPAIYRLTGAGFERSTARNPWFVGYADQHDDESYRDQSR